jgi:hypothetical protein
MPTGLPGAPRGKEYGSSTGRLILAATIPVHAAPAKNSSAVTGRRKLPITGELLRGSLLERTIRHTKGCPKCARGEGHHVFVLTVTYPGGRTRQFSVRRERVAEVRRWLSNYQELKEAIEAVCELNHDLLRPERAASKRRRKQP